MYHQTAQCLKSSSLKKNQFYESDTGRFLKSIDKGLPNDHTRLLYNNRPKSDPTILPQLRTGISRLNSYLFRIGAADSDQCICSKGEETVHHSFFSCALWTELRAEIMQISRKEKRWGDTSFLLGSWSGLRKDGELSKWKPNLQAVAAAIRFTKVTGRLTSLEKDEGSNELPLETPEVVEASEDEREEDTT